MQSINNSTQQQLPQTPPKPNPFGVPGALADSPTETLLGPEECVDLLSSLQDESNHDGDDTFGFEGLSVDDGREEYALDQQTQQLPFGGDDDSNNNDSNYESEYNRQQQQQSPPHRSSSPQSLFKHAVTNSQPLPTTNASRKPTTASSILLSALTTLSRTALDPSSILLFPTLRRLKEHRVLLGSVTSENEEQEHEPREERNDNGRHQEGGLGSPVMSVRDLRLGVDKEERLQHLAALIEDLLASPSSPSSDHFPTSQSSPSLSSSSPTPSNNKSYSNSSSSSTTLLHKVSNQISSFAMLSSHVASNLYIPVLPTLLKQVGEYTSSTSSSETLSQETSQNGKKKKKGWEAEDVVSSASSSEAERRKLWGELGRLRGVLRRYEDLSSYAGSEAGGGRRSRSVSSFSADYGRLGQRPHSSLGLGIRSDSAGWVGASAPQLNLGGMGPDLRGVPSMVPGSLPELSIPQEFASQKQSSPKVGGSVEVLMRDPQAQSDEEGGSVETLTVSEGGSKVDVRVAEGASSPLQKSNAVLAQAGKAARGLNGASKSNPVLFSQHRHHANDDDASSSSSSSSSEDDQGNESEEGEGSMRKRGIRLLTQKEIRREMDKEWLEGPILGGKV
ncbi:hypothetical protein HDV05_002340 [Chytridiales sp. JEL 0842]|nr:hypothetical protein HDV05_002340 [Chytridiales sp. JEL 0842]